MMTFLGPSRVYKPFQEDVPAGHSSFTFTLPRHYASASLHPNGETKKQEFYFSDFNIVPSFYNQRAAQLGLDFEEGKNNIVTLDLKFSFVYNKINLYKIQDTDTDIKWDQSGKAARIDRTIEEINNFFDLQKPQSMPQSPVFLDWCDSRWYDFDPAKIMPTVLEHYYKDIDEEPPFDYFDALPKSVRKVFHANNYKVPTTIFDSKEMLNQIRIRINLAPLTTLLLSTDLMLTQLGFSKDQYKRGIANKIVLENTSATEYLCIVAENAPMLNISFFTTTIIVRGNADRSESTLRQIDVTMAVFMHNEELTARLKEEFEYLSLKTNVSMNIQYDPVDSKFKIVFPTNPNIVANVHCDIELAERLGFGPLTRITQNMTSIPVGEKSLTIDAENKSRALAFNTGMLFATLDGATGRQTDGLDEPLLATLIPTESGTFAIKLNSMLRSFQLSTPSLMGNGHFPVKINLWTLTKNSIKVPLEWKVDVTVNGVLEGT